MATKTTTVTSAKELISAAKKAGAGDTILLASGNYGDVSLSSLRPTGTVTIKSANPDNDAVFESLRLTRVNNFVIEDIDIRNPLKDGDKEWSSAMAINLSNNISLVGIDFQGSMNGNRNDDGNGLAVTRSEKIAILDSTFQQFNNAVVLGSVTDVILAGNTIRDVREGVNMTQINGGLFERNYLTDIAPDASRGDHSDAFQVHAAGTAVGSSDLVFRSNVIVADSQGIFIRSERAAQGITHSNIVIENNYYEGNSRNALAVTNATNVLITDNSIREGLGGGLAPGIIIGGITNGVIKDNITPLMATRTDAVSTNISWANNIDTMDSSQRKGVSVESVFAAPHAAGEIDFSSFNPIDNSSGIGFRSVAGLGNLSGNTAAILASYVPQFDQQFSATYLV